MGPAQIEQGGLNISGRFMGATSVEIAPSAVPEHVHDENCQTEHLNPAAPTSESFNRLMRKGAITDIDQALGAEPVKEEINNIAEDVISENNNRNI